jgi:serine acetyltransferase
MNTNHRFPRAFNEKLQAIGVGDWKKDKTVIEDYSSIGAGVICIGPTTIQKFVLVGAGATVTGTLAKHGLYVGNIAKRIGWVGITGNRLQETSTENLFLDLITGQEYIQIGETLTKCT